jgi:hypothetical protein
MLDLPWQEVLGSALRDVFESIAGLDEPTRHRLGINANESGFLVRYAATLEAGIDERLHPRQFEHLVAEVYEAEGWRCEVLPEPGSAVEAGQLPFGWTSKQEPIKVISWADHDAPCLFTDASREVREEEEMAPRSTPFSNPFAALSAGRVLSARIVHGQANTCESTGLSEAKAGRSL